MRQIIFMQLHESYQGVSSHKADNQTYGILAMHGQ